MKVVVKSNLVPWRGNSWSFENPTERVYAVLTDPTEAEVADAVAFANDQYDKMGWQKCFVEPPQVVTA